MGHQAPDVERPTDRHLPDPVHVPPPNPGPPNPGPRRPAAGSSLALRNWPVTWRLIALIAIPTLIGLYFGGLRVAAANSSASEFSQVRQLALFGQQVTGLAQALEDERDLTAGYIGAGRLQAGLAQLRGQYAVTDAWAVRVRRLSAGIGAGYPVQIQTRVDVVLARLADLAGIRGTAQGGDADALPLIIEYTASINNVLSFNDEIAQGSASSCTPRSPSGSSSSAHPSSSPPRRPSRPPTCRSSRPPPRSASSSCSAAPCRPPPWTRIRCWNSSRST
jgi:hypothetical protein